MKRYAALCFVSLSSALLAIFLYRQFEPQRKVSWNVDEDGQARYASLVDKLFNSRNNAGFHSSAPTDFITAAEMATPAVVNIRAVQQ
ncbi:MAG TPA: hypothetical protein PLW66_13390, partial [Saprospiraceae bacterium]|nr:hypothetical protein [Saprospiraceae bacterium]